MTSQTLRRHLLAARSTILNCAFMALILAPIAPDSEDRPSWLGDDVRYKTGASSLRKCACKKQWLRFERGLVRPGRG